jgi:NAD(P)-dependent dehydrogenase (short-subunit alcohol dehydrogenase family)
MKTQRHALVTGAGTGIGRAIALRLASDGWKISLLARDVDRLEETRELAGVDQAFVTFCDVRDGEGVDRAFRDACDALGPLHALVANSGIGGPDLADGPDGPDRFEELVETNLIGTWRCLAAARAYLADGPEGRHLVVISSILARIGVPGYAGYSASKAGLLGLVRSLAAELGQEGVQVNAVCPGWVDTAMAREGLEGMARAMSCTVEEAHERAMATVPRGRMGTPEEIAGLVAWLIGKDSAGVTGQALDVNGGAWMA